MITTYSQRDPKWSSILVGTGKQTIGAVGCFITSLGNLLGIDPVQVNERLKNGGGFADGNMVIGSTAAKLLGLQYAGVRRGNPPVYPCIAMTRDTAKLGVPQHFFVWYPDGTIVDPYDKNPVRKPNTYKIAEWRLFSVSPVSNWAETAVRYCIEHGIASDWENPQQIVGSEVLGLMLQRSGQLSQVKKEGITKEQAAVLIHRMNS